MRQPPVAGQTYTDTIFVRDAADASLAKMAPTLDTANDFLISINAGAWDTLDNAPAVAPAGSEFIQIELSAAETTAAGAGGFILLRVADAAGGEWIGGGYRYDVQSAPFSTHTVAQVWAALVASLTTVGSIGKLIVDHLDAAISSRLASGSYTAPPSTSAIDAQLSAAHGGGSWATGSFATAANVSTAQSAILAAIAEAELIPAASGTAPNVSGSLSIIRASTFEATIGDIAIPGTWELALLTVKRDDKIVAPDAESLLQIQCSNPSDVLDGLTVLNAADPSDSSDATLTVNAGASTVTLRIEDDATALLAPGSYVYDIKFFYGSSESGPPFVGTLRVSATPTQTVFAD